MIPYGRQSVSEADIAAVVAVLRGDWLTQGPTIDCFEERLCEITGAAHAVAFTSGTAALHGAAAAAGLGPGDIVGTSSLTFSASAACARYVGAEATILDIDPATLNIPPAAVPAGLDALVAVHYAGLPMDLRELVHRPPVLIEDAAHAFGGLTPDGPVGGCAHSDLCCLSFHPVKPITSGEGGAVTTNDAALADELRRFRNHGIERMPDDGSWYYEIHRLGYNYRLTDLQAALGLSQLDRLEQFIDRRNEIAARYRTELAALPVELPPAAPAGWRHGYHLFAIRVDERRRVFDGLRAAGIGVQVHYVPLHRQPVYADLGLTADDLPEAERAYQRLISLPIHPELSDDDQTRVVEGTRRLGGLMASGGLLVVIQARMGSTRLPGKVMADIGGQPALGLQLARLRGLSCRHLAVATSDDPRDDPVAALAERHGAEVVRGSETDVLGRFGLAVERFDPDDLVRLTGDCPLTDPAIVEAVVALHHSTHADYTSNIFPRSFPKGLDVEVATRQAFDAAIAEATDLYEREHVMPFLYHRAGRFELANLTSGLDAGDEWWTLDTAEDLERLRAIAAAIRDIERAPWREILDTVGRQASTEPSE